MGVNTNSQVADFSLPSLTGSSNEPFQALTTASPFINSTTATTATDSKEITSKVKFNPVASSTTNTPTPLGAANDINHGDGVSLVKKFLNGKGDINCLDAFFQSSYRFRLFMTNEVDPYIQALNPNSKTNSFGNTTNTASPPTGEGGKINPNAIYNALKKLPQVTIAETGVTTYNIKSVQIESVVGPNPVTRSINSTRMTIVVTEPMGVGFMDSIKLAAEQLKIKNYSKCFYYLELTFLAYDAQGNIVENPVTSLRLDGVDRWIYQIQITDVDIHLDAGGGTYTMQCIQYNDVGWDNDIRELPEAITASGATLGDMFTQLGVNLSDSWKQRHGDTTVQWGGKVPGMPGSVPAFIWHPMTHAYGANMPSDIPGDPAQFKTRMSLNLASMRAYDLKTGDKMAQFQSGMTLDKMIEAAFISTKEAADMISRPAVNGVKEHIMFRVVADVYLVNYDPLTQQYYRVVSYNIYPYYTLAPVSSQQQPKDADNSQTAGLYIEKLLQKGFMKKRYDYLYTGLNTEITDFDIHYNLKWCVLLARVEGLRANLETVEVPQTFLGGSSNDSVTVNPSQEALTIAGDKQALSTLNSQITQMTQLQDAVTKAQTDVEKTSAKTNLANYKATLGEHGDMTALTNARDKIADITAANNQRLAGINNAIVGETTIKSGNRVYSEDLIAAQLKPETKKTNLSIAFSQSAKESIDATGTGTTSGPGPERSIYGAVVDQLNAPDLNQFVNITMTIRGDPYWLGQTNICNMAYARNQQLQYDIMTDLPDWTRGDYPFLLKWRFPKTMNGEFIPEFQEGEIFNGIYRANRITHIFSDGIFKQTIIANRMPLIDIVKASGYTGVTDGASSKSSTPTASNSSRTPVSNPSNVNSVGPTISPDNGDGQAHPASSLSPSATVYNFISQPGVEGCKLQAYNDGGSNGGTMTIGYGHTGTVDGQPIVAGMTITQEQANSLRQDDLTAAGQQVANLVTVPLTQNQFDALTSFTMNEGQGSLNKSTLLKDINSGNTDANTIQTDFAMWNKMNGQVAGGLVNRRTAEANMFNGQPFSALN